LVHQREETEPSKFEAADRSIISKDAEKKFTIIPAAVVFDERLEGFSVGLMEGF
jgi:hypothetical protein